MNSPLETLQSDPSNVDGTASNPVVEFDASVPLVHASVNSMVGALLDPAGKEGATRLLLRLQRRTAGGLDADRADDSIDRMGGHLGADVSRSIVSFHGSAIARSTRPFLEFFEDTLLRPGLADDEFQRLRAETKADLVERLDDDRALARSFWNRKLFTGHPYARPPGGTLASLDRIEVADLRALYEKLFVRKNLRFAFAGQIDRARAREAAEKIASGFADDPVTSADPAHPTGPVGRHLLFVDKPDRTQTQILIGGLGTHPADADHTALHVGNTIFGGTFTARLSQEVRAKRGWSYGAYSSLPIDRRRQAFSMWTFPAATDAAACIRLELELLERWVENGVTSAELSRAKKYLIKSHAFALDTASKRASLAIDQILYELPPGYQTGYLDRVSAITLDQVNAALRERISPKNLVITVVGTHKDLGASIREAIGDLTDEEVVPFDSQDDVF